MSSAVGWIAAEAERPKIEAHDPFARRRADAEEEDLLGADSAGDEFSGTQSIAVAEEGHPADGWDEDRERRVYRARTVTMLRRYMQYSIETGRLPSILGREFFRAKVTSYTVVTFEDRVIFVHDMETCLSRLDEFSRQLIARHILQEHDRWATAKLLHCSERSVRRYTPVALDLLSEILLDVGLLTRTQGKSCQGGKNGPFSANDSDDAKYKF